jgi:dCTP diphosphatase
MQHTLTGQCLCIADRALTRVIGSRVPEGGAATRGRWTEAADLARNGREVVTSVPFHRANACVASVDDGRPHRVLSSLRAFVAERDWAQFHTSENLAKSISIEAGELLECFQWGDDPDVDDVRGELADVLTYCYLLAEKLGVDADEIVLEKLAVTREKYPVEKFRGRSSKYDEL